MSMNMPFDKAMKLLAGTVSAIAVLVGVAFTADERYAKAADVQQMQKEIKQDLNEIRRAQLEDQLFVLEQTPESKRTDLQRALIERVKRQLGSMSP